MHCMQSMLQSTQSVLYAFALLRWPYTAVALESCRNALLLINVKICWIIFMYLPWHCYRYKYIIFNWQFVLASHFVKYEIWRNSYTRVCCAVVLRCVVWRRHIWVLRRGLHKIVHHADTYYSYIAININNKCWHLMGDQFSR